MEHYVYYEPDVDAMPFGPTGLAHLQAAQWSVCSTPHPQLSNGNAMGDGVKSLTI